MARRGVAAAVVFVLAWALGTQAPAGAADPPAAAAELVVVNDATNAPDPLDVPTIRPGSTGGARGLDLVAAPGAAFAAGEEVAVVVADADGGDVGFAAPPLVSAGGAPAGEVTLADGGARLVVRLGPAVAGATRLRIRNVVYAVSLTAAAGPVGITATWRGAPVPFAPVAEVPGALRTNAVVSDVATEREGPPLGAAAGPPGSLLRLPPVVLAESRPGALGPPLSMVAVCLRRSDGRPFAGAGAVRALAGAVVAAQATLAEDGLVSRFAVVPTPLGGPVRLAVVDLAVPGDATGLVVVRAERCGGPPLGSDLTLAAVTRIGRLGGSTRYATAARVAEALAGPEGAPVALVARGDDFADALAAAYLARALDATRVAPLLLVPPDGVPAAVTNALRRMGTKRVVVLGGPFAVSPEVTRTLDEAPAYEAGGNLPTLVCEARERSDGRCTLAVDRISGPDRFATAAAVALAGGVAGRVDLTPADGVGRPLRTVFVARGDDFADALAVAPLAVAGATGPNGDGAPIPLLLTRRDALPPVTWAAMAALGVEQVVVVGGPGAVGDAVVAELAGTGLHVVRIGGINRQETAGKLATLATTPGGRGGFGFPTGASSGRGGVVLARGDAFADALAFGPWCGVARAPLLLTASPTVLGEVARAFLDATAPAFATLTAAGGTDAVSDAVVAEALSAKTGALIP